MKNFFKKAKVSIFIAILLAVVVTLLPFDYTEALAQTTNNLKAGGGGLAIPQTGAKISSAISQKSFADSVLLIVNYFIGFFYLCWCTLDFKRR